MDKIIDIAMDNFFHRQDRNNMVRRDLHNTDHRDHRKQGHQGLYTPDLLDPHNRDHQVQNNSCNYKDSTQKHSLAQVKKL